MARRNSVYIIVIGLLVVTTFGAGSVQASGKQHPVPTDLYRYVLEAQGKVQIADAKMITCVLQLADLVSNYFRQFRKFPSNAAELQIFAAGKNLTATNNPYMEHEYLARELPANTPPVIKIEILEEYGLSGNGLRELANHPPANWEGTPGTVVIAHNSENQFYIRACGLNRKPVEDGTKHGAYYIFKNLSE